MKFDLDKLSGSRGGVLMRTFNPGVWGSLSVTDTHLIVGVAVGKMQVDNQLQDYALDNRIIFTPEHTTAPEWGQFEMLTEMS